MDYSIKNIDNMIVVFKKGEHYLMGENELRFKGNELIGRITTANTLFCEKTCHICGRYFRKGEKAAFIVPAMEYRKKHPELSDNKFIHVDEFNEFVKDVDDLDAFYEKLASQKAKKEKLSEENHQKLETFIDAAYNCGYRYPTKITSKGTVKCKINGKSDYVTYNVYADHIEYGDNRKGFLFDSIIAAQKVAKVYNEFHALLGDGLHDDFDALKTIGEVINDAHKTVDSML
jgi:hypothetical protein